MPPKRPQPPPEAVIELDEDEIAWAEDHIYDGADEMFQEMDVDGSGMVDQEEAVAWLAEFDYFSQEAVAIFHRIDRDKDGEWNLADFRSGYASFIKQLSIKSSVLSRKKHDDILMQRGYDPHLLHLFAEEFCFEDALEDIKAICKEEYKDAIDEALGPQKVRCIAVYFYTLWEEWSEAESVEVIRDAFADALEEERLRVIRGLEARGITSKLCDSTVEKILVEMARDEAQLHVCDRMAEIGAATTMQRMSRRTIQLKKYFKLRQAAIWEALKGERTEIQACEQVIAATADSECLSIAQEVFAEELGKEALEQASVTIDDCLDLCQAQVAVDAKIVCKWMTRDVIIRGAIREGWHRHVMREEEAARRVEEALEVENRLERERRETLHLRDSSVNPITATPENWNPPPRSPRWPKRRQMPPGVTTRIPKRTFSSASSHVSAIPSRAPSGATSNVPDAVVSRLPSASSVRAPPLEPIVRPVSAGLGVVDNPGVIARGLATIGHTWGRDVVEQALSVLVPGLENGRGGEEEFYMNERALMEAHAAEADAQVGEGIDWVQSAVGEAYVAEYDERQLDQLDYVAIERVTRDLRHALIFRDGTRVQQLMRNLSLAAVQGHAETVQVMWDLFNGWMGISSPKDERDETQTSHGAGLGRSGSAVSASRLAATKASLDLSSTGKSFNSGFGGRENVGGAGKLAYKCLVECLMKDVMGVADEFIRLCDHGDASVRQISVDALGRAVSALVRVEKPSDEAVWRPEKTRRFVEHREALERANRERIHEKAQERVTHLIRCLSWILDDRDKSVQGMAIEVVGQAANRLHPTAIAAIIDMVKRWKDADVVQACVNALTEAAVAGNESVVLTGKSLCKSKAPHIRKAGLDILASFLRGFPTAPPPPTPRSIDSDESIPLPAGSAMQAVQALKKDTSAVNSPGRQPHSPGRSSPSSPGRLSSVTSPGRTISVVSSMALSSPGRTASMSSVVTAHTAVDKDVSIDQIWAEALEVVIARLADREVENRSRALSALLPSLTCGVDKLAKSVLSVAKANKGGLRAKALRMLSKAKAGLSASAAPVLIDCIKDKDIHVRLAAVEAFMQCNYDMVSAGVLLRVLEDRDKYVRVAAAKSLMKWGKRLDMATAKKLVTKAADGEATMNQTIRDGLIDCLSTGYVSPMVEVVQCALEGRTKNLTDPRIRGLCCQAVLGINAGARDAAKKSSDTSTSTSINKNFASNMGQGHGIAHQSPRGTVVKLGGGPSLEDAIGTLERMAGGMPVWKKVADEGVNVTASEEMRSRFMLGNDGEVDDGGGIKLFPGLEGEREAEKEESSEAAPLESMGAADLMAMMDKLDSKPPVQGSVESFEMPEGHEEGGKLARVAAAVAIAWAKEHYSGFIDGLLGPASVKLVEDEDLEVRTILMGDEGQDRISVPEVIVGTPRDYEAEIEVLRGERTLKKPAPRRQRIRGSRAAEETVWGSRTGLQGGLDAALDDGVNQKEVESSLEESAMPEGAQVVKKTRVRRAVKPKTLGSLVPVLQQDDEETLKQDKGAARGYKRPKTPGKRASKEVGTKKRVAKIRVKYVRRRVEGSYHAMPSIVSWVVSWGGKKEERNSAVEGERNVDGDADEIAEKRSEAREGMREKTQVVDERGEWRNLPSVATWGFMLTKGKELEDEKMRGEEEVVDDNAEMTLEGVAKLDEQERIVRIQVWRHLPSVVSWMTSISSSQQHDQYDADVAESTCEGGSDEAVGTEGAGWRSLPSVTTWLVAYDARGGRGAPGRREATNKEHAGDMEEDQAGVERKSSSVVQGVKGDVLLDGLFWASRICSWWTEDVILEEIEEEGCGPQIDISKPAKIPEIEVPRELDPQADNHRKFMSMPSVVSWTVGFVSRAQDSVDASYHVGKHSVVGDSEVHAEKFKEMEIGQLKRWRNLPSVVTWGAAASAPQVVADANAMETGQGTRWRHLPSVVTWGTAVSTLKVATDTTATHHRMGSRVETEEDNGDGKAIVTAGQVWRHLPSVVSWMTSISSSQQHDQYDADVAESTCEGGSDEAVGTEGAGWRSLPSVASWVISWVAVRKAREEEDDMKQTGIIAEKGKMEEGARIEQAGIMDSEDVVQADQAELTAELDWQGYEGKEGGDEATSPRSQSEKDAWEGIDEANILGGIEAGGGDKEDRLKRAQGARAGIGEEAGGALPKAIFSGEQGVSGVEGIAEETIEA